MITSFQINGQPLNLDVNTYNIEIHIFFFIDLMTISDNPDTNTGIDIVDVWIDTPSTMPS